LQRLGPIVGDDEAWAWRAAAASISITFSIKVSFDQGIKKGDEIA
jgi:hypothetical protein